MGNLHDYFRAPGPEDAATVMKGGPADRFDTVEGLEPQVVLARLIGFVRGVEWTVDLVDVTLISEEDSEYDAWVTLLDDDIRDTLADIPADDLPALAQRWEGIEEFSLHTAGPLNLLPHLRELVALAGRTREAGQHLYVWMSL